MFHLTARVAWHDSKWNGCVCKSPSENPYCVALERIREKRDEVFEDKLAGNSWSTLDPKDIPPCLAESGGFMNPEPWYRRFVHPYVDIKKAEKTHGHLKPTTMEVPAYATFAIPFGWMLRNEQDGIEKRLPEPLAPDQEPPFGTAWVFSRERQEALVKLFFGRLKPDKSLVFFYCKEGQPLGDTISRLVLGVGRILTIAETPFYDTESGQPSNPIWERLFRHSIRPDGHDGFLLPYHAYLEPTGDPDEDARRLELLQEIAVAADAAHMRVFSYAAELAPADVALSTLVRCLESVRKIKEHGIAEGPWAKREEWLNEQIALTWQDRGAFPGLGPALEALGMRLGTALSLELLSSSALSPEDDPWPLVDELLRGDRHPPQDAYAADLEAVRNTWVNLEDERRTLLVLLSRFALTTKQALRAYDVKKRARATTVPVDDEAIIKNPYRISEVDLGDADDSPISVGMIDRGLMPDCTIAAKHPVPEPSAVGSPLDYRRVRAAIVAVLRQAADAGDALLSASECIDRLEKLDLSQPCMIGMDWIQANEADLAEAVEKVEVVTTDPSEPSVTALQLADLKARETHLAKVLAARAKKPLPSTGVDWKALLIQAIFDAGGHYDPGNPRHAEALTEQVDALERITCRKLSVLTGRAGSGKTSVMGALTLCEPIAKDGILFLAPTGKARVRLGKATNAEAMTVAQFLHRLKRYDGARQRPRFEGGDPYRKEKTVVIDECSMLTMDDLAAVLNGLDKAHVERIILVGDPNQLPPIGVGRPFADLANHLESNKDLNAALARLSVEVRATITGQGSDTLRLAAWFTREQQAVDADRVLSDLETGGTFNDLQIGYWKTAEELRAKLLEAFVEHLGLENGRDITNFDASLGLDEKGWVPFDSPNGAEAWQVLTPVRMQSHGVVELNRWVQRHFRANELESANQPWGISLGDEHIVKKDKVIQIRNQIRDSYNWETKSKDEHYLANGEVGMLVKNKTWLNGVFAGRPNLTFGYSKWDFPGGAGPLELAYALTVHKSQGSEFRKVFVVLPKNCRLISRELLYTALTRSRDQLILLIEGEDPTILYDLTRPERSETARRNTNLFHGVIRTGEEEIPYAEHLIHRTRKGHMVRSKSELVIANLLYDRGIEYHYERKCEGTVEPGRMRPDFSFESLDGDLIIWEHLGMLHRADYRQGWEWKKDWYRNNGYIEGENLFISMDDEKGGLDSGPLEEVAMKIKDLIE